MPIKWKSEDYESLEAVEALLDEWGNRILDTLIPKNERLRAWLGGRVPTGENQFGLAGDEEVLFGLAVDLRQFMGAESEEYLECCNATVMLVGRLMALTIDHGEYIFTQTPLNKFYRTLELSGLNEFADTIDGETIRRHRLIERLLGFADDLCETYSGRRPLSHYYESDAELFYACRDVYVDACKGYRPNERIPIGDGPYGTGVYGPEGKPDDGEGEEVDEVDEVEETE